jgi:hypothetical protein
MLHRPIAKGYQSKLTKHVATIPTILTFANITTIPTILTIATVTTNATIATISKIAEPQHVQ